MSRDHHHRKSVDITTIRALLEN